MNLKSLYTSKYFILLGFMYFFKPGILNHLPSLAQVASVYNLLGTCLLFIILFSKFYKLNRDKLVTDVIVLLGVLLFSTIINEGEVFSTFKTVINLLACCIFTRDAMENNPKKFITVGYKYLRIILIINLVLMFIFPNGLYTTKYYHNNIYFINSKN